MLTLLLIKQTLRFVRVGGVVALNVRPLLTFINYIDTWHDYLKGCVPIQLRGLRYGGCHSSGYSVFWGKHSQDP